METAKRIIKNILFRNKKLKAFIVRRRGIALRKKRLSVQAEWTRYCNLKCPMCTVDDPTMRPGGHMSMELWRRILDCCKREGHFVDLTHVIGEPLLWKHFYEGMSLWRESGLAKFGHIYTNGVLLTDERIDCIAETGLDYVRICIDTLRPDVYEKIRARGKYDKVIGNIRRTLDRAPDIQCQIELLRTSLNPDESAEEFFKEFGRRPNLRIMVSQCLNVGGDASLSLVRNPSPDPRTCDKLDYEHVMITWDGQIGLCCIDMGLLNRLGSMDQDSISEVYLGKYAEKVRRSVRKGDYSLAPACKTCPMDHVSATYSLVEPFDRNG